MRTCKKQYLCRGGDEAKLKKDFMTFYVNFPEEVIEAAKAAALEEAGASADDPDVDIVVDPDVELADKTSSNCELLHKLDRYR